MANVNTFNRITGLLEEIAIQGDKIEDVASKTDILSNVARLFADLGIKTKDYSLIEKALTYASNITYDYRRVIDKVYIGRLMHKFGKKINALNLSQVAESSSKRIKDLTLKINAMLKIAELRELLGEQDEANDLYERSITTIDISSNTLIVKVDAYLSAYRFFMNIGKREQASPILDLIFKFLEENTDPSIESQILRSVINTIINISQKTSKEPVILLSDALKMLDEFQTMDDIDLVYNDILKQIFKIQGSDWIEENLDLIIRIIDSIERQRVKMEIIYNFLIKAYNANLEIDPEYVQQLIEALDVKNTQNLNPGRYISFQLMKFHLIGIFVSNEKYYVLIENLLKDILHSTRFTKNLPDKVQRILNNMVEFFQIIKPSKIEILENAVKNVGKYGLLEIKDGVLRNIVNTLTIHGRNVGEKDILNKAIDFSKKIDGIDDRIFVLCEIGDAYYELNEKTLAKDIVQGCLDELENVKEPRKRIQARIKISEIILEYEKDINLTINIMEKALQDANLYLASIAEKSIALQEIGNRAAETYRSIYEIQKKERLQKYNILISNAKELLDQKKRDAAEKALQLYSESLGLINESEDKYEYLWISDQIDRLKNYIENFEVREFPEDIVDWTNRDKIHIKKSDIVYKQTVSLKKKRELLYHIEIINKSKIQITELNCRIKKYAGEFLELMHDNVQKTNILKPNGTFSCDFYFMAKRDIIPKNAIEAEINFFDFVDEKTITINIEPPVTSSYFKFFMPKSIKVNKLDKLKQKLSKRSHEITLPLNVYITWKKLNQVIKNIPFKVIQKDSNEIANQFFGVVRLYAESRWIRRRKSTLIQIIISGELEENDTNIKLELFLQDETILYYLVNLIEEAIEVFNCPNESCEAPLDIEQLIVDGYGVCKYCKQPFYFEGNVKKLDKPIKIKQISIKDIIDDDNFIEKTLKRFKKLDEEEKTRIIQAIPDEDRELSQELFLMLFESKEKPKDVLQNAIKNGSEKIIQTILLSQF